MPIVVDTSAAAQLGAACGDAAAYSDCFEMKQKLNAPGPSALMQTAGLSVNQP